MRDHSHPEPKKCPHDLSWCDKCERPYCKMCGQEWVAQTVNLPTIWYKDTTNPQWIPNQWQPSTTIVPPTLPQWLPTTICEHK